MSKLEELLKKHCPDGVEYKLFSDVAVYIRGVTYSKSKEINNNYEKEYWQILRANNIDLHSNTLNFDDIKKINKDVKINENQFLYANDIIICAGSGSKEHIGKVAFIYNDIPYSFGGFMGVIRANESILLSRYLFHVLTSSIFKNHLNLNINSSTINNLSSQIMNSLKIPIPPIEVQKEIVRILDTFTKYQDLLNRELELRKKQYEYYRDKLLTFTEGTQSCGDEVEYKTVGDVGLVTKLAGFEFTKYVTYSNKGKIIALRGLNVKNGRLNLDEVKYIDESDLTKLTRSKLYIDDMLFTYVGTIGEVALIDENDKYYLAPNVALIRFDKKLILPKFMIYYFQSKIFFNTQINKLLQSSSMKNIPMEKIRKFLVPIPPLEEQERIVNILDKFDALCNDITRGLPAEIELRKKQYEYYRDKLLTFKEKKV